MQSPMTCCSGPPVTTCLCCGPPTAHTPGTRCLARPTTPPWRLASSGALTTRRVMLLTQTTLPSFVMWCIYWRGNATSGCSSKRGESLLQVVVLLNGKPVTDYTFSSGVFKTTCAPLLGLDTPCCPRPCLRDTCMHVELIAHGWVSLIMQTSMQQVPAKASPSRRERPHAQHGCRWACQVAVIWT